MSGREGGSAGPFAAVWATPSDQGDAIRLEAFLAVDDFDPDPLAGTQSIDATAAQGGDVDEHVLATTVGRNEAVAFFGLEPFHRALHGRGRPGSAVVHTAGAALRHYCRAVVDIQDIGDQRTFCSGADLADDRGTFAHVLIPG